MKEKYIATHSVLLCVPLFIVLIYFSSSCCSSLSLFLLAVGKEVLYSALYSLSLLGTCCWLSAGHCIHLSALQCCLHLPLPSPPPLIQCTTLHRYTRRRGGKERSTHIAVFKVIPMLLHHDTPTTSSPAIIVIMSTKSKIYQNHLFFVTVI